MRSKVMTARSAVRKGNGDLAPPRVAAELPRKSGELPIPVATFVSTGRTARRTTQAMRISVVALVCVACGRGGGAGSVSSQPSALEAPDASAPVQDAAPLDQT